MLVEGGDRLARWTAVMARAFGVGGRDKIEMRGRRFFVCCNQVVPPHSLLECNAELLLTLRGTEGKDWRAGEQARCAIRATPFGPRIYARVRRFLWSPSGSPLGVGDPLLPDQVVQAGCPNWAAWVVEPLLEPGERFIVSLLRHVGYPRRPDLQQGDLEVYYVSPEAYASALGADDTVYSQMKRGELQICDHYLSSRTGPPRHITRAIGDTLFVFADACGGWVWVLSCAHINTPLEIRKSRVLFAHPFPKHKGSLLSLGRRG